jgi:hypothetical protein
LVICGLNAEVIELGTGVPDELVQVTVPGEDPPKTQLGWVHVAVRFCPVEAMVNSWDVLPYVSLTLPVSVRPPVTVVELPQAPFVMKHWMPVVCPDVMFVAGVYSRAVHSVEIVSHLMAALAPRMGSATSCQD